MLGLIILMSTCFLLWQRYYPVTAQGAWQYKVLYKNIKKASALFKDQQGNLIITQEINRRQGKIISIAPDGKHTIIFENLDKPAGITPFKGGIVFTQEGGLYPVSWHIDGKLHTLFIGTNVQGLTPDGQYLYAVEDRGTVSRVLRYDSLTGTIEVIRKNLNETETLAICPDGRKFYNEKEINVVRELTEDGADPIILDAQKIKEPSTLFCDEKGLWISEDSTHQARLLLLTPKGKLEVILTHLKAPQQLLAVGKNKYYLAESGRNRVIEIELKEEK